MGAIWHLCATLSAFYRLVIQTLAPMADIFSQLATILGPTGTERSDQVFAQAGNGVDFCFLHFFL